MRNLATRLALLIIGLSVAGCVYLDASVPPCPSLLRSHVKMSLQISGAEHYNRWARTDVRHSVLFRLRGPTGLVLWRFKPNLRQLDCVRVSEKEVDAWASSIEILLQEPEGVELLDPVDAPPGEMLLVTSSHSRVAIDARKLTAEGLDAARVLSCLSVRAFGSSLKKVLVKTTPELAANIDFPSACNRLAEDRAHADMSGGFHEAQYQPTGDHR